MQVLMASRVINSINGCFIKAVRWPRILANLPVYSSTGFLDTEPYLCVICDRRPIKGFQQNLNQN